MHFRPYKKSINEYAVRCLLARTKHIPSLLHLNGFVRQTDGGRTANRNTDFNRTEFPVVTDDARREQTLRCVLGIEDRIDSDSRNGTNTHRARTSRIVKNRLPEVYQARQKQSAIVRGNDIYLFGGQDQTSSYSDVYRGRLNSIDWK